MEHLTLMAVHAHPDDEAIGTGGTLAKYAAEGIRTVLVTCTNGELGDLPGGIKPDHDDHAIEAVVELRLAELRASCEVLGVAHLELLGYHDSGMAGWPQNDLPGAFWNTPIDAAAERLAALMQRYRPDIVVTYDENGFYGHPDHIQANRITLAAAASTGIPRKLYYTAVGKRSLRQIMAVIREQMPDYKDDPGDDPPFGIDDELITTVVDCAAVIDSKRASMEKHASQAENIPFLKMPQPLFAEVFGQEGFVRVRDTTGASLPEDDLFAGLR